MADRAVSFWEEAVDVTPYPLNIEVILEWVYDLQHRSNALYAELFPDRIIREKLRRFDKTAAARKAAQRVREARKRAVLLTVVPKTDLIPIEAGAPDSFNVMATLVAGRRTLQYGRLEWTPELERQFAMQLRQAAIDAGGRLDFLARFIKREDRLFNFMALLRGTQDGILWFETDSEGKIWVSEL
jgi:hypothetical protein